MLECDADANTDDGDDHVGLSGVLGCAESYVHASNTFAPPDEVLYEANPFVVVALLDTLAPFRGALQLSTPGSRKAESNSSATHNGGSEVPRLHVVPSAFERYRAPTIRFYSAFCAAPTTAPPGCLVRETEDRNRAAAERDFVVRVERVVRHTVTLGCMRAAGARLSKTEPLWNLHWGARLKDELEFTKLQSFQKVNHFPGTWVLGRKDALAQHVRRAAQRHRDAGFADIAPVTYSWPVDMPLLQRDVKGGHAFVVKPPARARGEGISLFSGSIPSFLLEAAMDVKQQRNPKGASSEAALATAAAAPSSAALAAESQSDDSDTDDEDYIVQRYIANPMTVNGFKVDLRVYAVCTSWDPLRVYVYNDGLVRFATEKYPAKEALHQSLSNVYCHLTNYSVNKQSSTYHSSNRDGEGSKWSFRALRRYFEAQRWSFDAALEEVHDVIVKTFIAAESTVCAKVGAVKHRFNCFELYGFDVLLDEHRKAHLIEVNVMPSLACGAAIDKHIKGNLIADLLTLVGIPLVDKPDACRAAQSAADQRRFRLPMPGAEVAGEGSATLSLEACNNLESRPTKFIEKQWSPEASTNPTTSRSNSNTRTARPVEVSPGHYFAKHATEHDKLVLRDTEEEYRRRLGFQRVFPAVNSESRYGAMFVHKRHFNVLLWKWEQWKQSATADELYRARQWLAGSDSEFPHRGKDRRSRSQTSTRTAQNIPRCASLANVRPRVSSSPRVVAARAPELPPIDKRCLAVQTFTFVPVVKPGSATQRF